MPKVVVASGFFNPLHWGHLYYLKAAKDLGETLIVIVNNDKQVELKRSIPFMDENTRLEIVKSLNFVDGAILAEETDTTTSIKTLRKIIETSNDIDYMFKKIGLAPSQKREFIFAKGGDRNEQTMDEQEKRVCEELGCKIVYGVGGSDKVASSSDLIKKAQEWKKS